MYATMPRPPRERTIFEKLGEVRRARDVREPGAPVLRGDAPEHGAQRALGGPLLPLRKRARVAMRDIVDTFDRLVPTGDLHTGDEATSEERATGDL